MTAKVNNGSCDRCGACISVCPANALMLLSGPVIVDEVRCTACGNCVKICPFGALSLAHDPADTPEIDDGQ
jgi:ferredoxin